MTSHKDVLATEAAIEANVDQNCSNNVDNSVDKNCLSKVENNVDQNVADNDEVPAGLTTLTSHSPLLVHDAANDESITDGPSSNHEEKKIEILERSRPLETLPTVTFARHEQVN